MHQCNLWVFTINSTYARLHNQTSTVYIIPSNTSACSRCCSWSFSCSSSAISVRCRLCSWSICCRSRPTSGVGLAACWPISRNSSSCSVHVLIYKKKWISIHEYTHQHINCTIFIYSWKLSRETVLNLNCWWQQGVSILVVPNMVR